MTKVALRGIIPDLKNAPVYDAYAHFRAELGPPDDESFNEEGLEWFYYDSRNHEFAPVLDRKNDQWAVETVVQCSPDYDFDPVVMELEWVQSQCEMMEHRFGAKKFFVVAYSWYTGVDEPYSLTPTHKLELKAEPKKKLSKKRIREIAGEEGFWKRSCEDTFLETAQELMDAGFSEDEAIDLLACLYGAVSSEYGG